MAKTTAISDPRVVTKQIQTLSRPKQLAWFGSQLDIPDAHLLRLIGYASGKARELIRKGQTVEELASAKPEGTLRLTEILREMTSREGYDLSRVAASLRKPPDILAAQVPPKGKKNTQPKIGRTPSEKYARAVRLGGPGVYWALTQYLRLARLAGHGKMRSRGAEDTD